LWLLGPILMPFAVGAAVGYFLDPLVSQLERRGVPRAIAAAVMVLSLVAVLLAALVLLVPLIAAEAATLIRALPDLHEQAQTFVADRVPGFGPGAGNDAVSDLFARIGETMTESGGSVFGGIVSGLNGLLRVALFWMVMPVVAFYLLMDWPRLLLAVDDLLPRANVLRVRALGRDIDAALAGYVRGVVMVCLILAVYYAIALTVAGLSYGLLVGVVAGLISFVPYVGAFVGGALAIGLALYELWDNPLALGAVVAIWVFGQFMESQILVPRLVGSSVNLHPVWLIFAVMAFGSLFGLLGAIVAVPLAAVMGVLVRFALEEYRASHVYDSSAATP
ncbi:AI-2E family transporter, partial [Rhodobaculum claviforme]|uniref:AI-2E family transporter n=1 Tax=Rhodobaculum claviforme TaxID=1549854 RepID=UPI001911C6AC